MEIKIVPVDKPEDMNFILGQAHFIKTVEDLHEAIVTVAPGLKFGLAFCESSGLALVRRSGNDDALVEIAVKNALAVGAGHSFFIFMTGGFPVNILNAVKAVPEVCGLYCATANPAEVIVAENGPGPGHPRRCRRRPDQGRRGRRRRRLAQGLPAQDRLQALNRMTTLTRRARRRTAAAAVLAALLAVPLAAQFRDDFDGPLVKDRDGVKGWGTATGEGAAVMGLLAGPGRLTVEVDATRDRRNVWWAIIVRQVSPWLDLARLARPGAELRVEARVRTDTAPRRINLSFNTQKTTDFHSHLMEYDLAEAGTWYTISLTTRDFEAGPGDTVNTQMALMDWGLGRYRVDVDYFRVDVVEAGQAGPDLGPPIPYHPPVADPAIFGHALPIAADLTVDLSEPGVNLDDWAVMDAGGSARVLSAGGTRLALLRWDFGGLAGRKVAGPGLLELTTRALSRSETERPDFGELRVVEIIGGDPGWDERTATWTGICRGATRDLVLNPQMIIDWPVTAGDGGKTYLTIPAVVLQRLIDGRTLGLALTPLGSIEASFYAREERGGSAAARLRFNIKED